MAMDREIAAMAEIAEALDRFGEEDLDVVVRILQWATSRYGVLDTGQLAASATGSDVEGSAPRDRQGFEDLADLFHVTAPRTAPERTLVASYWVTSSEGQVEFTAQLVNSKLKDLGYGVSNITEAFTTLMKRRPSLVMQTAKQGKSRQARKRYKLTRAGHDEVEQMIRGESETST